MQTFCPKHFTLEDIDCADPQVDCPPRVPVDPAKHVILTCGPCERTRVVPVDRIMRGRVPSSGTCQLDVCAAVVVPRDPIILLSGVAQLTPEDRALFDDSAAGPPGHDPDTSSLVGVPQEQEAPPLPRPLDQSIDQVATPQGGASKPRKAKPAK